MRFILSIFFLFGTLSYSYSQGLFFNNIDESQWVLADFDSLKTFEQKGIGLYKLRIEKASIKSPVFIWTFNEKIQIKYYDPTTKSETLINQFKYEVIEEKIKKLRIYLDSSENHYFDYDVGIISTGSYVGLYKRKKKK
ncbi:hypothetical protein [Flavivirga eckloniae]|nr:hypothetical protein [Flavivirga eckloniae]